jgi:hypothetical protein
MALLLSALAQDEQHEALQGRYFMVVWGYQGPNNAPKDFAYVCRFL